MPNFRAGGVMVSQIRHGLIVLLILAAGFGVASVQAGAQTAPAEYEP